MKRFLLFAETHLGINKFFSSGAGIRGTFLLDLLDLTSHCDLALSCRSLLSTPRWWTTGGPFHSCHWWGRLGRDIEWTYRMGGTQPTISWGVAHRQSAGCWRGSPGVWITNQLMAEGVWLEPRSAGGQSAWLEHRQVAEGWHQNGQIFLEFHGSQKPRGWSRHTQGV